MIRAAALAAALLALAGCDDYRNSPEQQVKDYKLCTDSGMDAYLNGLGEIGCSPPASESKP